MTAKRLVLFVNAIGLFVSGCADAPPDGPRGPGPLAPRTDGEHVQVVPVDDSGLPERPALVNVRTSVRTDSVDVFFDPVDGARDYRIYELPSPDAIEIGADGHVTVRGAVYRCAGERHSPVVLYDDAEEVPGTRYASIRTRVDSEVAGVRRTEETATLGWVFRTEGEGRVPVYALGDPRDAAENSCFNQVWTETRRKVYTTSADERARLLAEHWRDDGVVFWVPAEADVPIYVADRGDTALVFPASEQDGYRLDGAPTEAFRVLGAPAEAAQPLMRVHYQQLCGGGVSHDELVVGRPAFERARYQGPQPWTGLHWAGIEGPTTLVVEALDGGCPYQGHYGPMAAEGGEQEGDVIPPTQTFAALQDASPTRELFINGQAGDGDAPYPDAIARSFVRVAPAAAPEMDWFLDFSAPITFQDQDVDPYDGWTPISTEDFDLYLGYGGWWSYGVERGQLWVGYTDRGGGAKTRLTPREHPELSDDRFLHATMTVDAFTTARRYPQILISDLSADQRTEPLQEHLTEGRTVVVQTFENWPLIAQIQLCDHRHWEVNDHCPQYDLQRVERDGADYVPPRAEIEGGIDQPHQIDVYASTRRVYVFVDAAPYGCADLRAPLEAGPGTLAFGDVAYHTAIDFSYGGLRFPEWYPFAEDKLRLSRRHFDDLGYRAGVNAPAWDEVAFPCQTVESE